MYTYFSNFAFLFTQATPRSTCPSLAVASRSLLAEGIGHKFSTASLDFL